MPNAVTLPEPRPEDDEDVVWGLSTATALWARGERRDAIVWIRRAAEAAISAGQEFRASELGLFATALEDVLSGDAPTPVAAAAGALPPQNHVPARGPSHRPSARAHAPVAGAPLPPPAAPPWPAQPLAPNHREELEAYSDEGVTLTEDSADRALRSARPLTVPPRRVGPHTSAPPPTSREEVEIDALLDGRSSPPAAALPRSVPPPPPGPRPRSAPPPPPPPWTGEAHPRSAPPPNAPPWPTAPQRPYSSRPPEHGFAAGPPARHPSVPAPRPPTPRPPPPVAPLSGTSEGSGAFHMRPLRPPPMAPPPPRVPNPPSIRPSTPIPPPAPPPQGRARVSSPVPPAPSPAYGRGGSPVPPRPPHASSPPSPADAAPPKRKSSRPPRAEGEARADARRASSRPPAVKRTARGAAKPSEHPAPSTSSSAKLARSAELSAKGSSPPPPVFGVPESSGPPDESAAARAQAAPPTSIASARGRTPSASDSAPQSKRDAPKRSRRERGPILDPWSEDFGDTAVSSDFGRSLPPEQRTPVDEEDDDGVVTSAPQLNATMRRKPTLSGRNPPPLPGRAKQDGEVAARPPSAGGDASPAVAAPTPEPEPTPPAPAPAEPTPATPAAPPTSVAADAPTQPEAAPRERHAIGTLPLDTVDAFSDLPPELHKELVALARVEQLGSEEEVSSFGAALVVEGQGAVCAAVSDAAAERASRGTLIATRGTLEDGVAIRLVAGEGGAHVAVWPQATLETALASCPWVLDALRREADRLQALSGATIGPLGDLDETLRNQILGRMSVRHIAPNATVVPKGTPLPGLAVIGAGDLAIGDAGEREAGPGDFLFASQVMRAEPAPETARAGSSGALILIADRQLANELFVTVPHLVELLAS